MALTLTIADLDGRMKPRSSKKGSKYFSVRHETILLPSFMWNLE